MATKKSSAKKKTPGKSVGRDRARISSQKHEIAYAGKKLGKGGAKKVAAAKKKLGRVTSRKKVMAKARSK